MGIKLELQSFIGKIDQDYLIGLSNKGTVKRAEKDLENAEPVFIVTKEDICMEFSDVQCHFVMPVENFTCSCPSRSMCRHRILGLLYLMKHPEILGKQETVSMEGQETEEKEQKTDKETEEPKTKAEKKETGIKKQKTKGTITKEQKPEKIEQEIGKGKSKEKEQGIENQQTEERKTEDKKQQTEEQKKDKGKADKKLLEQEDDEVLREIAGISLDKLKKVIGKRKYEAFLYQAEKGYRPEIEKTSIYTVSFKEEGMIVKLLSPLNSSSCSCHKKTLCAHKALAILCLQLSSGMISLKQLKEDAGEEIHVDIEGRRNAGKKILDLLLSFIKTGMSRQGEDFTDRCYQMALLCHNCRLPIQEREFRSLGEEFRRYQKHSSEFQIEGFTRRLHRLYEYAEILTEGNVEKVQEIAGEFKDKYYEQKNMVLYGVGQQSFLSESGYEGLTTWFLRIPEMNWYSFTRSLPNFYDSTQNRRRRLEKEAAPWNLGCATELMPGLEILLENPKISQDHRLSSSEGTKGHLVQAHDIFDYHLPDYYQDFKIMAERVMLTGQNLVFVEAKEGKPQEYDTIRQCYRRILTDGKGRSLKVELKYSAVNKKNIEILEHYGKQKECPVYFGKLFLQEGELRLEPIEVFNGRQEQDEKGIERETSVAPYAICIEMKALLKEAEQSLEYMILGGFSGFYQTMEELLKEQAQHLSESGLTKVGDAFYRLTALASEQRKQVEKQYMPVLKQWNLCCQYLMKCKKKLEEEMILSRLTEEESSPKKTKS